MSKNNPKIKSDPKFGLTDAEAKDILRESGPNRLLETQEISFFDIAREELTEPMILLLLVVGFFYAIWGKLSDAITIFSVILILVFAEIWNEYRAKKAISSLARLSQPKTKVIREGKVTEIETEKVVPGDILALSTGTRIAADGKVLTSFSLEIDESSLTGESYPAEKDINGEIYAGTLVAGGEGKARVAATGKNTRLGKISAIAQEIKSPKTPLQIAMKSLSKSLVWIALLFSIAIPVLGFLRGGEIHEMILVGLALAFAFIPEEMPIIITMVLGLGSYKLSHENFLVKKLKAAETMGTVTVILTDKTGTITENKMKVVSIYPESRKLEILANAGDTLTEISLSPTDQAISDKIKEARIEMNSEKIIRERNFGDGRKTKSVLRRRDNNFFELSVIGAPEEIMAMSIYGKQDMENQIDAETAKGKRVIAVAQKIVIAANKNLGFPELEKDLTLSGIISLEDPPRKGVKETIENARKAGIRTMMVTGDHPKTAASIAKSVGIPAEKIFIGYEMDKLSDQELEKAVKEISVFSRATPEHKYRLVNALRKNNEVVAVTGDGVNDALALKAADIGIAMGIKGTDVAREAADAILIDDNFITIGRAIFEGRKFFDNLKKGVKYYLSVKVALASIFLLPIILNIPFPFAPIQIIIFELFMDLAASAGFVSEPAEKNIYSRPPRDPKEKFLTGSMLRGIAASGLSLFLAVSISYLYGIRSHLPLIESQTMAFSAWLIGHIFLAYVSRSESEPLLKLGIFTNKIISIWALAVFAFLLASLNIPAIENNLKLTHLNLNRIGLIVLISLAAVLWREAEKMLFFKNSK